MPTRRRSQGLLATCAMLVAGCTVADRDVSRDEHFLVGYSPGQTYRLTQPLGVLDLGDARFELLPPGAARQYRKPAGTLAEGTRIDIVSLRHWVLAAPVQWESRVDTEARIAGQPGLPDRAVYLNDVSGVRWIDGDCRMKTPVLLPDRRWLELVTPATSTLSH